MNKTIIYALKVAAACFLSAQATFTQTLKADYQFQGNLNSSVAGAPALTNLVGAGNGPNTYIADSVDGYSRQVLNFPLNNGVAINSLVGVVPDGSFTVVVLFKFGAQAGRRRVYDSSGGTAADQGGFMVGGRIEGEDTSVPPNTANTYFQIVIVRGNGVLQGYREGNFRVSQPDPGGPLPNGIRWFQDYVNNPIQASGGAIARMRFYDAPMTAQQVRQLDRIPEAPTGPMPIAFYSQRNGNTEMFRMNTDGTSQRRLSNTEAIELGARFSPDGQKIVYHRRETPTGIRQVWLANADGSNPVQLTNTATNNHNPSWRSDGQKILYSTCDVNFICDIATMDPNGSNQALIPGSINTAVDEDQARYTPDGSKIVFICISDVGNYNLCTANADGSNRTQITNTGVAVNNLVPDISPDATKIIFIRGNNASNNRTYVININGSGELALPQTQGPATPLWSPDGTKIAYTTNVSNSNEIFVANSDGTSPVQITFNSSDDRLSDWYRPQTVTRRSPFDFDGDGKTDVGIFRPSVGEWWYQRSSNGTVPAVQFGTATDRIVPGDYTGDGKTDIAFWRPATGEWFILRSEDSTFFAFPFGSNGDIPAPADYDADGRADAAVFRPSTTTWFISNSGGSGTSILNFGISTDKPVVADYDGDAKADIAIWRAGPGEWWVRRSTNGSIFAVQFGVTSDRPVQGDFTGDGEADIAFWRPADGNWFVVRSEDFSFFAFPFGSNGDVPAPGDYDGDGRQDAAVWRPSSATWFLNRSTAGIAIQQFGLPTDTPIPSAFVP